MIRAASAIARFDEASASVIVLLGPWQSMRIEMWQASMLGRYFSSQIGSITPIDSRPQVWKSKLPVVAVACAIAGASSSSSVEISPAPRSMPIRVGSTPPPSSPASSDRELGRRDAELDVPGHVLAALPQVLDEPGLGQRRVLQEVEIADLGAEMVGQALDGERLQRPYRTLPLDQGSPEAVGRVTQRSDQAQTGDDHAAFGTKHE